MKNKIIFCLSLLVLVQFAAAQVRDTTSAAYRQLKKDVSRGVYFPRGMDSVCSAIFTVVTIPVRGRKTPDSIGVSGKFPELVREGFKRIIPKLPSYNWEEIFPEVKGLADYDVLLPFTFNFEVPGCFDTLPQSSVKHKLSYELYKRRGHPVKAYTLPAMQASFYGMQR